VSIPPLVLASASPRRQSLLSEAGYSFIVDPANIDEENLPPGILPADAARDLARIKADTVAVRHPNDVVLGADTVVALGDYILGKPRDIEDARRILTLLSGTTHIVITGIAVVHAQANFSRWARVMSAVRMRNLSDHELETYLATGQWEGKAGAYGIQDNDPFVTRMSGSMTNIVGLPVSQTKLLLAEAGIVPIKPTPNAPI